VVRRARPRCRGGHGSPSNRGGLSMDIATGAGSSKSWSAQSGRLAAEDRVRPWCICPFPLCTDSSRIGSGRILYRPSTPHQTSSSWRRCRFRCSSPRAAKHQPRAWRSTPAPPHRFPARNQATRPQWVCMWRSMVPRPAWSPAGRDSRCCHSPRRTEPS
jgi:hypothetical protein